VGVLEVKVVVGVFLEEDLVVGVVHEDAHIVFYHDDKTIYFMRSCIFICLYFL